MKRDIDTTKPHTGRVYDYLLGGTQNFEADRQAAAAIFKVLPSARAIAQLNRWFLQLVASRWAEQGHTSVLDLGSGLPTQGHFNEYIPHGRILFSDHDALCVEHGQDLLKDQANMHYVHADLRDPGPLLETAAKFFTATRKLAVGCIGVSYFLEDEVVRSVMQRLHAFSAPGSVLALSYFLPPPETGPSAEVLKVYLKLVNTKVYTRTPAQVKELIAPWRVSEDACLEDWLAVPNLFSAEDRLTNKIVGNGLFAEH